MKKSTKIPVCILSIIGVLGIILVLLNNYAEYRIKKALEQKLTEVNAEYEKVDVNLLSRKAEISQPLLRLTGKTIKADQIELNDIHLWNYLTKKDLIIEDINISNPVVKIYKSKKEDSTAQKSGKKMENKIEFKNLNISKGTFEIFGNDSSSHKLFALIDKISFERVRVNSGTLKNGIPFSYKLNTLQTDSIFFDLDAQHTMVAANLRMKDSNLSIRKLQIIPKYSKDGHQKTINVEKDRYDLSIDSIDLLDFNWNIQDSLSLKSRLVKIDGVNFDIYRDKLKPDDTTFKPMYSRMLRNLPIKLGLDSVTLSRTNIKYEENIHEDRETAVVNFTNMNASLANITNIGMNRDDFPQTRVHVKASFMKTASLNVDLNFDVRNKSDQFHISGQMGGLAADQINQFLKPAMNIEASGEIVSMFFNFSGTNVSAVGDVRLEYNNFKVEVLRKDGKRKNKVISALANLIVKNKAMNDKANYKDISVKRDQTKSFWNYLWSCVKSGALKTFL